MNKKKYKLYFSEKQKRMEENLDVSPMHIYINGHWRRYTEMARANNKCDGWIPHEERFDDSEFLGTLPESRVYIEHYF